MKIKMKDDADIAYIKSLYHSAPINWHWVTVLALVSGLVLDVETEFLFKNQFNTAPVAPDDPGLNANVRAYLETHSYRSNDVQKALESICETGLRIMERTIDYVIDDERPGKARCNWCGKTSISTTFCSHCKSPDYLEVFKDW